VYAAHHSNYGGSSQHGGAFPHRGLRRRAAPRARPRGARLAHGLLRRRGTCLSAFPPFPVARPPNRVRPRPSRARRHAERPPRTREGGRARSTTVFGIASSASRWRIARARLRSGLGSGCTLRSRDVEDKMRPAPEGPTGSRRRAAVSSTPRSASPKRALHETLAHLDSTAHRSRFPRSSLAAPPVCRRRSGKSRRSTRTATPFAIPCT
jgi:hypothetical protein